MKHIIIHYINKIYFIKVDLYHGNKYQIVLNTNKYILPSLLFMFSGYNHIIE